MKFRSVLIAAAAIAFCSSPAAAKLMDIKVSGDFNDDPNYVAWAAEAVYRVTPDITCTGCWESGYYLGLGGTSVLAAKLTVQRHDGGQTVVHMQNPGLSISRDTTMFLVDFYGDNASVTGVGFSYFTGLSFKGPDQADYLSRFGDYGWFSGDVPNSGNPHTHDIIVSAHVPEPSVWGVMIVGFGLSGSALRTRRRPITNQ